MRVPRELVIPSKEQSTRPYLVRYMNGAYQQVEGGELPDIVTVDTSLWNDLVDNQVEHKVLDHGMVVLTDMMPRRVWRTADDAVIEAARCSYHGVNNEPRLDDIKTLRYLMEHRHTSPFEMVEFKFKLVMPIFVARQWIRHRTANLNEYSARYSIVPDRFYIPASIRGQGKTNKQGSEGIVGTEAELLMSEYLNKAVNLYGDYEAVLEAGVSRELARIGLPVNIYTEMIWKIDLHNLLHLFSLRAHSHAQEEIRVYAEAMYQIVSKVCPWTIEAFEDFRVNTVTLYGHEMKALKNGDWSHFSKRAAESLCAKTDKLREVLLPESEVL